MDAKAIRRYIGVEEATEMGHMKQTQQGIKPTTKKSRRGQPAKVTQKSDRTNAMHYAISVPNQEPKNKKNIWCLYWYSEHKDSLQANRPEILPGCQT